jgi:hypothetical protein
MNKWLFAMPLLVASVELSACPLCLGAYQSSTADQLLDRPQSVLAVPSADGSSYRVIEVIKGPRPAREALDASSVHLKVEATGKTRTLLLVRDDASPMWVSLGAIGAEHASLLRRLAAGKHPAEMGADEWRARLSFVLPYLENAEPLVAEIAYGEFASAPYASLLAVKSRLAASAVRGWLAEPALAARQPLYLLLLGIAGNAQDAARLEQRLEIAAASGDATNLGSMLAADLQLRGPARMAWVDANYMHTGKRSTRELEAVLLALSVHGNINGVIPRERVLQSYRRFMSEHKDVAGFVAPDLAAWQYWDAVPAYVALMKSSVQQQYPSRLAIVAYLRQSPWAKSGEGDALLAKELSLEPSTPLARSPGATKGMPQ